MRRQWLGGVATLTVCAAALVADAQVRLSCGPAGRGRAAADGAHCECVAPLFAGTAAGECISAVVSRAHFQRFRANEVRITYPFVILPPR